MFSASFSICKLCQKRSSRLPDKVERTLIASCSNTSITSVSSVPLSLIYHKKIPKVRTRRSNDLSLLFRVGNTLQTTHKQLASIDNCEINAKVLPESLLDLFAFVQAHKSIIDGDSMKAVPDSFPHQLRSDSTIYTATASPKDECAVTDKLSDASNLELDEVAHFPIRLGSADVDAEVAEDLASARCLDLDVSGSSGVMMPWDDEHVRVQDGIGRLIVIVSIFPC